MKTTKLEDTYRAARAALIAASKAAKEADHAMSPAKVWDPTDDEAKVQMWHAEIAVHAAHRALDDADPDLRAAREFAIEEITRLAGALEALPKQPAPVELPTGGLTVAALRDVAHRNRAQRTAQSEAAKAAREAICSEITEVFRAVRRTVDRVAAARKSAALPEPMPLLDPLLSATPHSVFCMRGPRECRDVAEMFCAGLSEQRLRATHELNAHALRVAAYNERHEREESLRAERVRDFDRYNVAGRGARA
jgi:hypothetical protein